jgi:hypothetical protein
VGKAVRNVELMVLDVVEREALPLAELRGAPPDIHEHVEDLPSSTANELGLSGLEVHPSHYPAAGAGMVVLDEAAFDAEIVKHALPEGLEEEAAVVAVDGRRQQQGSFELGRQLLHLETIPA